MSATGRDASSAAADVAAAVREAGLVRLVARADGDALAAAGVLARALEAAGTPYQATLARPFEDAARATEADAVVAIGTRVAGAAATVDAESSASAVAFEAVRKMEGSPDPVLAFAGTVAAGAAPGPIADALDAAGHERRAGVAVPVADLADGLAHSTLVHAPFSGDPDAAREALAELDLGDAADDAAALDEEARRRVASLVALAVAGADDATTRAARLVERALRPHDGGPFATVGGYADVLDACARTSPGVAVALAVGHDGVREEALAAWREHARAAHAAVRDAETTRYDGLYVVETEAADAPLETVARLVADFRAPEPVTLVVGPTEAAVRATDDRDVADAFERAVAALADGDGPAEGGSEDGTAGRTGAVERLPGREDRARARLPAAAAGTDARTLADRFREEL